MDLTGPWLAHPGDDELRRAFPEPSFEHGHWEPVPVPGHWRSAPALAGSDGPLLYRTAFDAPAPADGQRAWLTFDGIFYQSDVWLDGRYVGDTEGYFFPHTFEITDDLRRSGDHHLAVEVTCSPQHDRTAKRNITGVFQHWDLHDPAWNPGGIWRPVRVTTTGAVRISRLRVRCTRADGERATVAFRAYLDAADSAGVTLRTSVGGTDHRAEHPLAAGQNRIEWEVHVERPELWWPHALGDPVLHDVAVAVDVDGAESDRRQLRTGLRQVEWDDWVCRVNGERLFLKGTNQGPTRMALAEATAEDLRADVAHAVDLGLDLLRVHAHVSRPELYDAADEAGLLLWQDFPLQWAYARGLRKQAVRQATEMVDLLAHRPSIVVWCGHNEPLAIHDTGVPTSAGAKARLAARFLAAQELPTWNKTVLDRSIKRAIEKADGTRLTVAHSGVWPHLPQLDGTDTHVYFGWYHGEATDFPTFCRAVPRMARFVTEFGAQAVPESADFMEPERWPDLDWERLEAHHCLQRSLFDRHVPPADHATFASWRQATQRHQAEVTKLHVETLRRLKYRPTGGFAQFCLADGHAAVTWSVLDHQRIPKAAHEALRAACRPVIVVADWLPETVHAGDALALDVHVVSDLREPLGGVVCRATLSWTGGEHRWAWAGDVLADAATRVGTVQAVVPDRPGPLTLALEMQGAGEPVANRYRSTISPAR